MVSQRRPIAAFAALALLVCIISPATAQTRADCERAYQPQRGQEGKDVIWVPTEDAMVGRMLEMANVTADDVVYDLGAGDGKIPIAAAKLFGARAVGIEYDAGLAAHAQCLVAAEGVADLVTVVQGDIFEADFSAATVVTLYLLPDLNVRLRPTLLDMRAGTRVVSYSFTMGDWEPDDFIDTDEGSAYLWIVPAKVAGGWTFREENGADSFDVELEQTYQVVEGAAFGARLTGKVSGDGIELQLVQGAEPIRVTGIVTGDRIAATLQRGGSSGQYIGTRR